MRVNKTILQALIKAHGEYLIGDRQTSYYDFGQKKYKNEAIFFSPNVPLKLISCENIGEKPFDEVEQFLTSEVHTNIFLGKSVEQPFQWGIHHHEFISVEPVTCKAMDLIVACYENDISEYYEVLKKMKELTVKKE